MKRGGRILLNVGCALAGLLALPQPVQGADGPLLVPRAGLQLSLWAREPMVMDPVAVAFDDAGAAYVAETARRSTVDIDIRSHRDWLLDDLACESVDDLRVAFHRWMAPERSLENASWLADRNQDGVHDWQDLREIRERVRRLEDTTGAGRADRSEVLAEGFNEEISGVLAGVLPVGRQVWATAYPNLVRFTVSEGESPVRPAEAVETVFRGFGVHAAFDGHDLHGLILGPEGRLYFTCGDNGFSVTNREGRRLHYPHTGGVLRMDPDGSNLEVFASGLRNPQEIAFDDDGNWFAVDNDGDLKDERERFVFVAEGSDSGWRLHWQFREPGWSEVTRMPDYNPWVDERMWIPHHPGQPAHIVPAITNYSVGPGSLRFNPGTALSEADRGYFFLIQFPVQKVTAFQAVPRGAGFEMAGEHVVLSGMMASALAFTPQGALCVGDWDGLWEPNGTGGLWMLDDPKSAGSPLRLEVARLLREGMSGRDEAELVGWLAHADQRIRLRAQWELVRRGARRTLLEVAGAVQAPSIARVHALWGLTRVTPPPASGQLPLQDASPRIRAQAAKAAGELRLATAVPALIPLLSDPESPVRFQAAIALGKIGSPAALSALVGLLATNNGADPFLRHAGVMGLAGAAQPSELAALAAHPSAAVRIGAVVALRRLQSPEVAVFLKDPDPGVLREAVRAIHDDDSTPGAMEALAALIRRQDLADDEAVVRRVLNAQLRGGRPEHAEQLMRYAMDTGHPEPLRIEALEALGDWDRTPALDRVEGRVRPLSPRTGDLGRTLIATHLESLLASAGPKLATSATRLVTAHGIPARPEVFGAWVAATDQPLQVRLQALDLLAAGDSEALAAAMDAAERDAAPELRIAARTARARRDPKRFARDLASLPSELTLRERQSVLRAAGPLNEPVAISYLTVQMDQLARGDTPPELSLDVLEAARSSPDSGLQAKAAQFDQALAAGGRSARERLLLTGGNRAAGERVFRTSVNGQCIRCHDAGGEGAQAGPVLAGIGRRLDRTALLESLLDPGARIAEGFGTVSVGLSDGSTVEGIRVRETPGILTLRLPEGGQRDIPVADIRARDQSTLSAMPPMEDVLTLRELRDLVEFLASWR